jgi:hypothetical protein
MSEPLVDGEGSNPGKRGKNRAFKRRAPRKPPQDHRLITIATKRTELFIAPNETAWALIEMGGSRKVQSLGSLSFRYWLIQEYFAETDRAPRQESLTQAVMTLEAKARSNGRRMRRSRRDVQFEAAPTGHQVERPRRDQGRILPFVAMGRHTEIAVFFSVEMWLDDGDVGATFGDDCPLDDCNDPYQSPMWNLDGSSAA